MQYKNLLWLLIWLFYQLDIGAANTFNVLEHGIIPNGTTLNSSEIQSIIDQCAEKGGGTIYFPAGRYLTGTIVLKNNITLFLDAGAILMGSRNLADYPITYPQFVSYTDNYTHKYLIFAERRKNITICGRGTIDGQGAAFSGEYKNRPYLLRLVACENVTVRDVTIINSPMWVQHYLACDNVNIDGITVHSHVNKNNDGIDIDCCRNVRISNCDIDSGDDALVLKSTADRVCENVTVTNCILRSDCNAFKLGTESNGGFQNITFSNSIIYDTRLCGIALEMVDGGIFDRVTVSNIIMENVGGGIFIRLGHRARTYKKDMPKPDVGILKNVMINNIQATGLDSIGCSITGLPFHPVENVTLSNIRLSFKGGGAATFAERKIEEHPDKYPEYRMFGMLPAYSFYCRHVKNLNFQHIDLNFETPDHRPPFFFEDVHNLKIFSVDAQTTEQTRAMFWLQQVSGVLIHGCGPANPTNAFIYLADPLSEQISIMNNDLSNVEQIIKAGDSVNEKAVYIENNRLKNQAVEN
ncbi:glycoside hydrolase family 28 protein [candidate division KSB1 bacterium]|nr:glycoside hydrolase family 28 protein [candidate division KSB1 bacterium]